MQDFLQTAKALGLQDSIANPKRSSAPDSPSSWLPYYAGFSPQFVESVFASGLIGDQDTVLDPWNGAGTTTDVARRTTKGPAIGVDCNPAAMLAASARLANAADAQYLSGFVTDLTGHSRQPSPPKSEPLAEWLPAATAHSIRSIVTRACELLGKPSISETNNLPAYEFPPLLSFVLMAITRVAKRYASIKTFSNPAWRVPGPVDSVVNQSLDLALEHEIKSMSGQLELLPSSNVALYLADSRFLPIPRESVDIIVTSPPYCTRLDYVVNTAFELALIGIPYQSSEYQALRQQMTGTTLNRTPPPGDPSRGWGESVVTVLNRIRQHHSADSAGYYYKNFWQYFSDMHASLQEIDRVLVSGGWGLMVAQSSYYKDVSIDLPELLADMSRAIGMKAEVVADFPVPKVMTTMNSRAHRHKRHHAYRESIVAIQKRYPS